jgi:hypothetical protein
MSKVLPIIFVLGAYVVLPVVIIAGWVRWARRRQGGITWPSVAGLALGTASALLAIGAMLYARSAGGLPVLRPGSLENLPVGSCPLSGRVGLRSCRPSLVQPCSLVCSCRRCWNAAVLDSCGCWGVARAALEGAAPACGLVFGLILDVQVRNPGHELLTPLAFREPVCQGGQPLDLSLDLLLRLASHRFIPPF